MPEHPAARLVQHEVAQALVTGNPARLLPDGLAGRRRDAANDHVAHLALGMAADDVDGARAAHQTDRTGAPSADRIGAMPSPGASEARIIPLTRLGAPVAMSLVP